MTSVDPARALVEAMGRLVPDEKAPTALATVTGVSSAGVLVRFDGETVASARRYYALQPCVVGDRVAMLRTGSTWVVDGIVTATPQIIKAGTFTIACNASGDTTFAFPVAFPTACDSVVVTESGNPVFYGAILLQVHEFPNPAFFNMRVYQVNGTPYANLSGVPVNYVAVGR